MTQSAKRIASFIQGHLNLRTFLPLLAAALATTWYGLFYSVADFGRRTGGLAFMDMQLCHLHHHAVYLRLAADVSE